MLTTRIYRKLSRFRNCHYFVLCDDAFVSSFHGKCFLATSFQILNTYVFVLYFRELTQEIWECSYWAPSKQKQYHQLMGLITLRKKCYLSCWHSFPLREKLSPQQSLTHDHNNLRNGASVKHWDGLIRSTWSSFKVPFISAASQTSFLTTSDLSRYSTFIFVTCFAYSVKCLGFLLKTFRPLTWLCHLVLKYMLWNHYTVLSYLHIFSKKLPVSV